MCSFDYQAEGAAFSYTIMIDFVSYQSFGKKERKNQADRQREK
jgi:hypothetical protein